MSVDQTTPTVGKLLTGPAFRDAVHFALAPVSSEYFLDPGARVSLVRGTVDRVDFNGEIVGIIDPFLDKTVQPGERCWLFLLPNTVTSMRHAWQHPAFKAKVPNGTD